MSVPLAMTGLQSLAAFAAAVWVLVAAVAARHRAWKIEYHLASAVGIVLLVLYAAGVFASLPQPIEVIARISDTLGKWTYLLVGVLAFLETGAFVGLIAPGEATIVVGGVVAGQGDIDIRLLIGIVWGAAFLGDNVSFWLGHKLGREFMLRHGPRFKITEERLVQVEAYMAEYGGRTILIGRFVGLVRAVAPFIAGSSRMNYRSFLPYDVIGSGLWAATFCMLGYVFSNNIEAVIHWAERGAFVLGWIIAITVITVYLVRRFRKPEERAKLVTWLDAQEQIGRRGSVIRPLRRAWDGGVIPVARFFGPQLRFAWERLTPGQLGLEFTTVMAMLVTGGYTLYFYTVAAVQWPTDFTTRLNDAAFRVFDGIHTDWLNSLVELVTMLGAFPIVAAATLIAAAYCARHRRPAEVFVLIGSLAIVALLVSPMKEWIGLPRPPGSLVETMGFSYPSGHSAYAIGWITIAVTLQRIRGLMTRLALVSIAIGVATVVGLSRVYLRAHYLTDVIGGVALAVTVTSLFAATALLVLHVKGLRAVRRAEAAEAADIVD